MARELMITLHPFPRHTPPTAILFSTVEENNVFAAYHTCFLSHLQQLTHRHSAFTDLRQRHLLSFISCVKPKLKRLIVRKKAKCIRNIPRAKCLLATKDRSGSQTSHIHIERLANILFKLSTRRLFNPLLTRSWYSW